MTGQTVLKDLASEYSTYQISFPKYPEFDENFKQFLDLLPFYNQAMQTIFYLQKLLMERIQHKKDLLLFLHLFHHFRQISS